MKKRKLKKYNMLILKSLNTVYFQNRGKFIRGVSPACINECRPTGNELYVNIKVYYPYKPITFSLFFNEHNTDKEIQDELKLLYHLTDNFKYKYTVG